MKFTDAIGSQGFFNLFANDATEAVVIVTSINSKRFVLEISS